MGTLLTSMTLHQPMRRVLNGLFALFVTILLSQAAVAQTTPNYPPKAPADLKPAEATLEILTSHDLSDMPQKWWNELAAHFDEQLLKNGPEREEAMRSIIFLATYYPDKANFERNTTELYNIYRFNRDEGMRVMALAALYAIGDDSAMRLIAYHAPYMRVAPWEDSDLVRHVTEAAIMQYYGTPNVTVQPPKAIGVQRTQ